MLMIRPYFWSTMYFCTARAIPSAASRRAMAAPMPRAAPVTMATAAFPSTVLVLGLTLPGNGPVAATLEANAAAGLPTRLTLGQVRHYLDAECTPARSRAISSRCPRLRQAHQAHRTQTPSLLNLN